MYLARSDGYGRLEEGKGGAVSNPASKDVSFSAGTILTLKNRESIHFGFLRRGFVEKRIDS